MNRAYLDSGYNYLCRKEYDRAIHIFRKEAFRCHSLNAVAYLGYCHEMGYGAPRDPYTAMLWYRRAVEEGGEKWVQSWVGERLRAIESSNPYPVVSYPVRIFDWRIGEIVISPGKGFCSLNFKDGKLLVSGSVAEPYDGVMSEIIERVEQMEQGSGAMGLTAPLDENYRLDCDHFHLRIERGRGSEYGYRVEGQNCVITAPQDVVFSHFAVRKTIVNYMRRVVKIAAENYLLRRIKELSERIGLGYNSCEVKWLSKSYGEYWIKERAIKLNARIVLLSSIEIDSVIVHELCHQISPRHDRKFYDAMLRYGGNELCQADSRLAVIENSYLV